MISRKFRIDMKDRGLQDASSEQPNRSKWLLAGSADTWRCFHGTTPRYRRHAAARLACAFRDAVRKLIKELKRELWRDHRTHRGVW